MDARLRSLALLAAVLLASAGCDRPAAPAPAPAPPTGAPVAPAGPHQNIRWGAAVLPGDLAPAPWGLSVLFVDFDYLRAHPELPGRLNLSFAAPDLAAELGLLARDIHAVWMCDIGSTNPDEPAPIQTILVARVESPAAVAEGFEKRAAAGAIRRTTVRNVVWYEEPVTHSAVTLLDGRLVRARGANWLEMVMDVREGKRPSLATAAGYDAILDAAGAEVATLFVTNNRRYSRLRVLGEGLLLGASVTTPSARIGLMAFDTPDHAASGVVPLRMQFVEEADEGVVVHRGPLLVMTSPLVPDPRRATPPLDAAGRVLWGAEWTPRGESSGSFTVDLAVAEAAGGFPGAGTGAARASVPGLDPAGLVACHEVLTLREGTWQLDAALLEAGRISDLREALAGAAAAGGWKEFVAGPLRGWTDAEGGLRAVWEGRLLWARDRVELDRVFAARYRTSPSIVAQEPWVAELLTAGAPPRAVLLSTAPDPAFPGALLSLSAQLPSGLLRAARFPDPESAERARSTLSASGATVHRREAVVILPPPAR